MTKARDIATSEVVTGEIGSTIQAHDADLDSIAALDKTDGNVIVGDGTNWVAESGATARTSLGLGTAATTASTDYATAAQGALADSALQSIASNSIGANELNVSGNGTTSQFLRADGDGSFTWAAPSGGKILQVVQTVKSDTFTTTNQGFIDITGLSVSITPSSTSSKILVLCDLKYGIDAAQGAAPRLIRVGAPSPLYVGNAAGNRPGALGQEVIATTLQTSGGVYLDSPASTSALTYKLQILTTGGTCYVNRTNADRNTTLYDVRTASSITVLEVGA